MSKYVLREYQQEAVTKTIDHFKSSVRSAVIVLPTGAGKSLVIAELAKRARGKIIVLAHVKELVEQNHDKFQSFELNAGIFSAGLKQKNLTHPVTFASVQSLSRNLDQLTVSCSLLIIDECHRLSDDEDSQYQKIISHLKKLNSKMRVLGLTATPYRLGLGWIYQYHYRGYMRSNESRPFDNCIYELPLRYMITREYLTPPKLMDAAIAHYDFSSITPNSFGDLPEKPVNDLLKQCKRVTKAITQQIKEQATNRQAVMIFAATVLHAQEIFSYLPDDQAVLITGATDGAVRDQYINEFKQRNIKYLVNVSVLTTGFDAPHVDMIAILRPTASVSLYQQIVGRGLRLSEGKEECLIIDYAGNHYDLFQPEVGEAKRDPDSEIVQIFCPLCSFANIFWGKTDGSGNVIEHYGRRCQHAVPDENGTPQRCDYRFKFKSCMFCGAENDIAARQCRQCLEAITDPDEQLKKALQLKDALVLRCSGMSISHQENTLTVTYHDEDGETLKERFIFDYDSHQKQFNHLFARRLRDGSEPAPFKQIEDVIKLQEQLKAPDFVVAYKEKRFWRVHARIFDYEGRYRKAHQL